MPRYLRPKTAGGTFFFTVVTFGRKKDSYLGYQQANFIQRN